MRTGIVAFLAGNMTLLYLPYFPKTSIILIVSILLLILTGLLYWVKRKYLYLTRQFLSLCFLSLCYAAGFVWTALYIVYALPELDLKQLEGKTIRVKGQIVSLPQPSFSSTSSYKKALKTRFEFNILSREVEHNGAVLQDKQFTGKVRLSWYGGYQKIDSGQFWVLDIRLKKNNGLQNPGGFDYEQWLYQNHIQASGYVLKGHKFKTIETASGTQLRQTIAHKLDKALKNNPYKGLFKALAIGYRAELPDNQWQIFFRTGTNHLIAISGLHIGLLSALVWSLVYYLWRRSQMLNQIIPAVFAAGSSALLMASFYAAMAGFAIPTQRALVMLSVVFIAVMFKREFTPIYIVLWALLIVLIMDPLSSLSAGFWLSYGAVAIIMLAISARLSHSRGVRAKISSFVRVQWVIFIGLLPLMAILFKQFSVTAPLANLVAVPLMSLFIVPATLFGTLLSLIFQPLGMLLFNLLQWPLDALFWFLAYLSEWSGSLYYIPQLSLWVILLMIAGSLWLLMPRGWPGRSLGILLLIPVINITAHKPPAGQIRLTMLDVGQGLAMVIQTRQHTMVYDTGDNYSAQFNMADSVIIPFLRSRGIRHIDRLIISHTDRDHAGSYKELIKHFSVAEIISGEASSDFFDNFKKHTHKRISQCQKNDKWWWDGVLFEVLSPIIASPLAESLRVSGNNKKSSQKKNNNQSCVIYITAQNKFSYLLTGDIEKKVEVKLLKNYPDLTVKVLQVPHHGSKTSSSASFLSRIKPQMALFSYGYRNRFRHPSEKVVQRYQKKGVKLYSTANGAIDIKVDLTNNSLLVTQQRLVNKRFWHRDAEAF